MRIGIKVENHFKRLMLVAGVLAFFSGSALLVDRVLAQTEEGQVATEAGERLVSIHDRGEERVVVTKARTIRQALKAAKIEINEGHDVVEPGLDEELVASRYHVNIYRARPVTIIDGPVRQRVTTAQQAPVQVAKAAGITLYAEDEVELGVADDLLLYGADKVMIINRAIPVKFTLYGKEAEVRTQAKTVGEFLIEKEIKMGDKDTLSVSAETKITKGMSIELWRDGKQTVTVEEDIDFPVEQIRDANREAGYKQVKTPGEKGTKNVTYEIEMKNGKEVDRKEIASVTTKQPKKQVEVIGTKAIVPPYTGGGSKTEWLKASGIPESDWAYVDSIVTRESGWNPNAVNPTSGACGLGQQLPCGKWPGAWNDPVAALKAQHNYVKSRYGSYAGAVEFWNNNRYY